MFLVVLLVALSAANGYAQPARPSATLSAVTEKESIRAGDTVRLALLVTLPEGIHVQSNQPRDPSLIATALTLELPPGVTIAETVYPPATDLKQSGQAAPLAVFEREFVIGVRLIVGRDVPAGALNVPLRLRYQACDERVCYTPATARAAWAVGVVPSAGSTAAQHSEIFSRIAFARDGRR